MDGDQGNDNNPADATMVLADEVGETLTDGGPNDDPYNFAAALGLRKNLAASFDKHVAAGGGDGGDGRSDEAAVGADAAALRIGASKPKDSKTAKQNQQNNKQNQNQQNQLPLSGEKPEFSPKPGGVRSRILQLEDAARVERTRAASPKRDASRGRGTTASDAVPSVAAGPAASTATANCPKPRFGVGKKVLAAARSAAAGGGVNGHGRPLSRPRPPMAVGGGSFHGRSKKGGKNGAAATNAGGAGGGKEGSLLSVYLRIRPVSGGAGGETDPAKVETIEIVPSVPTSTAGSSTATSSSKGVSFKDDMDGKVNAADAPPVATTIRTYPPENSNAAKVLRTHPSSDMIFPNQNDMAASSSSVGGGVKEFKFTSVYGPTSTQEDVYRGVAKPLVDGLFPSDATGGSNGKLVGQSALLFAYGITNAGKTHTIMGKGGTGTSTSISASSAPAPRPPSSLSESPDMGVIPRALHDILQRVKDLGEDRYQVKLAYFEIYNEQCFDLVGPKKKLPPSASLHGPAPLKLRESRDGKIFVKGLSRRKVESLEHGLGLIRTAMKKRHTSSNNINSDSSRSHSICQLDIVAVPQLQQSQNSMTLSAASAATDDDDASIASGMSMASGASGYNTEDEAAALRKKEERSVSMWIVDLAGTERSKRTEHASKSTRQKEAALINSSLMKLMRCLHTLRDNQTGSSAAMVPFRESKLTHLFMNHLTGSSASRTGMIVNVNPSATDFDETQHVLSYATIAKSIVISEDDQERKRRADNLTHTHDNNGRSLSRSKTGRATGRSPPKKIARLAAKLSPRSMLAKRREQQADAQKRKEQLQQMRGATSTSSSSSTSAAKGDPGTDTNDNADPSGPKRKLAKISAGVRSSKQLQEKGAVIAQNKEEISRLHSSLRVAQNETRVAKEDAIRLREQLSQREAQIRVEVSEEMEAQISSMRDHYQGIIDRLKSQVGQTPGKSARKVRLDRAEMVIEELMDQVEECEEDAKRSREIHEESIANLASLHERALAEKEKEISTLKTYYEKVISGKEEEVVTLRTERQEAENEKEQMVAEYEGLLEDEREMRELCTSSGALQSNKSPAPTSVRRLRRDRLSEVGCTNAPPTPPRSHKKGGGLFSGGKKSTRKQKAATPLSSKSCNTTRESMESVDSAHDSDSSYSEYD